MEEKILLYALIFMLFFTAAAKAQHDTAWVQQLNATVASCTEAGKSEAMSILESLGKSNTQSPSSAGKTRSPKNAGLPPETSKKTEDSKYPRLLVFVSASESKADLKKLGQDLQKVGGRMIIRGLVENNMIKTQAWAQEVGAEILIDPTLFKAFHIARVPTFVLTAQTPAEAEDIGVYDRLAGNVTLDYALERFAKKGDVQDAQVFLSTLRKGTR